MALKGTQITLIMKMVKHTRGFKQFFYQNVIKTDIYLMTKTKNKTRSKEKRKYLNSGSWSTGLVGMWERMREMMIDI